MKTELKRYKALSIFVTLLFCITLVTTIVAVNQNDRYIQTIEMYEVFHDYNDEPYKLQIQKDDVVCMHFSNNLEKLQTSCDAYHEYMSKQETNE